jgi:hypothetical protein
MQSLSQEGRHAHFARRPKEKRCAAFHRQRLGLKNPAAGDTGLPEPLKGLPGGSIETVRTVDVGIGSCQSFGKEAKASICFALPRPASFIAKEVGR